MPSTPASEWQDGSADSTGSTGAWADAASLGDHPLAGVAGVTVGQGVRLRVEAKAGARGLTAFRGFLDSDDLGTTLAPVIEGEHHAAHASAPAWLAVTAFAGTVPVSGGEVEVPEGIDIQIVEALAALVPPGGHLLMEYGSDHRRVTARALRQGVPPVATPLGGMMFAAGCGVAFTDLRSVAGGEGSPALQGYRSIDTAHEARRGPAMLAGLEYFMEHSADLDWDLQLKCRPLAEAAITVLRARLGVLASSFDEA